MWRMGVYTCIEKGVRMVERREARMVESRGLYLLKGKGIRLLERSGPDLWIGGEGCSGDEWP